jgi:signal transduction histidine kinase
MGKQHYECSLCGKPIVHLQEHESSPVLKEVIDDSCYNFDTNECAAMFKRFRSVYGTEFKKYLVPQEQFVSDPFWKMAIPTQQEIREIENEKRTFLDKPETIKVLQDPAQIMTIGQEIGMGAKNEILIVYSSSNAFHRQEKLGAIQLLTELVEKEGSGVKARILTPKGQQIEESIRNLREQSRNIDVRYIEPGLQTYVTIFVVDRKSSLVVELKDDSRKSSYEAMGLGMFSNRKATVLSYVSIFESLWKQSDLNEKLSELCEQLKVRDNFQTEFINTAAHELRTPIQPILGLAEVLRSKKDELASTSMYDEYLSIIIRNARRLKDLTDNILDIARIESQSINLNKRVVDIDSVISGAVRDVTKDKSEQDVKLLYSDRNEDEAAADEHVLVYVDEGRINQVITNLINNAFNFTNKGSVIISREKRIEEGGSIIISVKDTGSGIDHQIRPRLFTKFATASEKGTGLGLYICKRIIEAHGGKIWGENNSDQGATFSFSLPTVKPRSESNQSREL